MVLVVQVVHVVHVVHGINVTQVIQGKKSKIQNSAAYDFKIGPRESFCA